MSRDGRLIRLGRNPKVHKADRSALTIARRVASGTVQNEAAVSNHVSYTRYHWCLVGKVVGGSVVGASLGKSKDPRLFVWPETLQHGAQDMSKYI